MNLIEKLFECPSSRNIWKEKVQCKDNSVFTVSSHALDLNGTPVSQLSEARHASTKALAIKKHYSLSNNTHSHKDKKKKNNHLKYTDLLPHNIYTQKQQHMNPSLMWQNLPKRVKGSVNKDKRHMFNKQKREGVSNQVWWENLTILRDGDFVWICMVWFYGN